METLIDKNIERLGHVKNECNHNFFNFKKYLIYLFLERGEGKEKEKGEKYQCVVVSHVPLTLGPDLVLNLGMCSDWELNE